MTAPRTAAAANIWIVLLAAGCGDAVQPSDSAQVPAERSEGRPLDTSALSLTIRVPEKVRAGEPVPLLLIVRNVSGGPVHVEAGDSSTTFDVQVRDNSGAVFWNRMHGREALASLHEHVLAPGQELRFSGTWDQRSNDGALAPAGRYIVRGTLDAQGARDLESRASYLAISPPR